MGEAKISYSIKRNDLLTQEEAEKNNKDFESNNSLFKYMSHDEMQDSLKKVAILKRSARIERKIIESEKSSTKDWIKEWEDGEIEKKG